LTPDFDREAVRAHEHWLCPEHFDPESLRIPMDVQSFVLKTDKHIIVVDTCCGNHKQRPGLPEFHRLTTGYLDRFNALGIAPEDVDFVMCTHLHIDHIGWNTQLLGDRWVPTFPNARYVVSAQEYANAEQEARDIPFEPVRNGFNDSILPIMDAGLCDLVSDDHEMLGMLRLRPAPGHTAANVQIELSSQGQKAIFAGDMLHTPMQIPFWNWSSKLCHDPVQAAATRRRLFEQCIEENALLVPGHFRAPHAGRIRDQDGGFQLVWGW
jgi:glyoxylase-like metal-dependent hydrolase (beta-lactamase superfamily II)